MLLHVRILVRCSFDLKRRCSFVVVLVSYTSNTPIHASGAFLHGPGDHSQGVYADHLLEFVACTGQNAGSYDDVSLTFCTADDDYCTPSTADQTYEGTWDYTVSGYQVLGNFDDANAMIIDKPGSDAW